MDTPPYSESTKEEQREKSLFECYFQLNEQWVWKITPQGALFAKERFLLLVKEALAANQPVSWALLLKVLHEDLGADIDIYTGVGAFPCMREMSHLLDFDLSKEEEQYGLASLMLGAYSNSQNPQYIPENVYYDDSRDIISFCVRRPVNEDAHLSQELQRYFRRDWEIRNASSKEKRELVRLKATIEPPSQDVQEKFEAQRV
jgi:hypothetical protein